MIKKNRTGFRIQNVRQGIDGSQLTRANPTIDNIGHSRLKEIDTFLKAYSHFLDKVRIAPDVVKEVLELYNNYEYPEETFSMINKDKSAFALVKFGKKPIEEGVRILYSHCDSPCLKTKSDSPILEWDPDKQPLHTGVELDVFGYGGIFPHQWAGKSLELRGWAIIDGKRKEINMPVFCPEICRHTDLRKEKEESFSEAHLEENLDLITGYGNVKDLLSALRFNGKEDFARARLFAVPVSKTQKIGPYYLSGYGHDSRSSIFSSLNAFLDTRPRYTSILLGFDKEEVGSSGSGGAQGKFFEKVFNETLLRRKVFSGLEEITEAYKLNIFEKSLAVNVDVDVGATNLEEDEDRIDDKNIAKLGYGVFVQGIDGVFEGDQNSPYLIDRIMNIFRNKNVEFQITGSALIADMNEGTYTINRYFIDRGFPTVNIGVPVGCTHSPEELIHKGDLFSSYDAYMAILESKK